MRIYAHNGVFAAEFAHEYGEPGFWDEKDLVKNAGFWFHGGGCRDGCKACEAGLGLKIWWTHLPAKAARLVDACDASAKIALSGHLETVAASRAEDADIDVPAPEGYEYLPYQRGGIAYAMSRPNTLIADEMGLGKTIQALGVVNATPTAKSVLCVVPASLRLNWRNEVNRWIVRAQDFSVFVVEKGTKRVKTGRKVEKTINHKDGTKTTKMVDETVSQPIGIPEYANFVVVNYDLLSGRTIKNPDYDPNEPTTDDNPEKVWKPSHILAQLMARTWDVLVIDEIHYLKNPKAARTVAVFGRKGNKKKKIDPIAGLDTRASRIVGLTGTPILNRPKEIQPILAALAPDDFGNFFQFAKRYCDAYQGRWGWDFSGASNLEELQERLRATIMVRRLKRDVLKELPAKRRQVVILPTNGAAKAVEAERKAYEQYDQTISALETAAELAQDSGDEDAYKAAVAALADARKVAFTEMSAVRRAVAVAKIPKVIEYIENALEATEKIVVFGHHREVCNAIKDHFGDSAVRLTGEDNNTADRQASVDRFQTDPACRVFVGSIKAAGVGHTLTASSTVIFAELDWTPANVTQAEDRTHRIGQENSVNIYHLVLDGSLDARMAQMCVDKQNIADRALDGDTVIPATLSVKEARTTERKSKYPPISDEKKSAAHEAMMIVASYCDGAQAEDGMGFNKMDTSIGKKLARLPELTDGQAWLAVKLARKYQRQIPGDILGVLGIGGDF